jgi:hypothetical protein
VLQQGHLQAAEGVGAMEFLRPPSPMPFFRKHHCAATEAGRSVMIWWAMGPVGTEGGAWWPSVPSRHDRTERRQSL